MEDVLSCIPANLVAELECLYKSNRKRVVGIWWHTEGILKQIMSETDLYDMSKNLELVSVDYSTQLAAQRKAILDITYYIEVERVVDYGKDCLIPNLVGYYSENKLFSALPELGSTI